MNPEKKVEFVVFDGKLYTVVHKYSSGYWEIRRDNGTYRVELVNSSEVQKVSK